MTDSIYRGRRACLATVAWLFISADACRRDDSPQTVEEAVARRDYDSALRLCESYFSELPKRGPNPEHTRLMLDVYRKSFVRWSLERRAPEGGGQK
jgi:hypothetical protein